MAQDTDIPAERPAGNIEHRVCIQWREVSTRELGSTRVVSSVVRGNHELLRDGAKVRWIVGAVEQHWAAGAVQFANELMLAANHLEIPIEYPEADPVDDERRRERIEHARQRRVEVLERLMQQRQERAAIVIASLFRAA